MHPVVNRRTPHWLDLAAAVLRYQEVEEEKVRNWVERRQETSLTGVNDPALLAEGEAVISSGTGV